MCILRSARNKPLAWSLIKDLSSKENTLKAALNGNGPVRASTYADARFASTVPYAAAEAATLARWAGTTNWMTWRVPSPAIAPVAKHRDDESVSRWAQSPHLVQETGPARRYIAVANQGPRGQLLDLSAFP